MKIIRIGELPEEIYSKVGGKARGLDFLKKNGFQIAEGFVITDIEEELSKEDFDSIHSALKELGSERVSVRSSATDEDGGDYSNAGQYATVLDVTDDKLEDAVRTCIASLHSERAEAYSSELSHGNGARMNVVVETMVDSRAAGVLFSTNPISKDHLLIESVDGQGENLVSGSASSYTYSLPKVAFPSDYEDSGNLSKELVSSLYEQGKKIRDIYGNEVDLEWAVDSNDNLFWLQLRPITALGGADDSEFDTINPIDNHLITSRNIGEMLPGAVTPLTISTSVLAIDYGMRNMMMRTGVVKHVEDLPDYSMALVVKNHLFIDMTSLHAMSKKVMMSNPAAMNLSIMGEAKEDNPEVAGKDANGLVKLINGIKFMKYLFSSEKAKKNIVKLNDGLSIELSDDPKTLYAEISKKLPAMNEALCHHYVCSSFSGAMNSMLYMTIAKDFQTKEEYQGFIASILSDIDGIESADILASLRVLAKAILAKYPDAKNYDEKALLKVVTEPGDDEIGKLYQEFLKKHGHRSIKEAELRSKAWKNDPEALMRNLRIVVSSDETETEKKPFNIDEHLDGIEKNKRGTIRWVGNKARQAVTDREFSKSNIIKVIDKFKDAYAYLAKLLVRDGYLSDEDSIYFLTHSEIGKLLEGDSSLKRKALSRRAEFPEVEEYTFDDVCIGKPQPIIVSAQEGEDHLQGIPVCKGRVYGRARIVHSVDDAQHLEKGEIMVASFTDIGWSPYYSLVGALVTEVGSALSHGAVVAREYCLPTVVNVKNATKKINTGDYLLVDATKGIVNVITEEEFNSRATI